MKVLGKCEHCGQNQAIIQIRQSAKPDVPPKNLCLICAEELGIPGIHKILELWGFGEGETYEIQEQINQVFSQMPEGQMEQMIEMSELFTDSPEFEELKSALSEDDPERAMHILSDSGLMPFSLAELGEASPDLKRFLTGFPRSEGEGQQEAQSRRANEREERSQESQSESQRQRLSSETSAKQPSSSSDSARREDENPLSKLFKSWTERGKGQAEPVAAGNKRRSARGGPKYKFLYQFGVNLNEKAKNHEIDPIVGRDKELTRVTQILNRRQKNNPALIGEPGVGKTAIAEGLAKRIVEGQVPAKLLDKELYLIDMSSLVAGTQFRGQFEARIKGVIDDAKEAGNVILVIDELHNIISAGDSEGGMNAANILKPALAKGEISVIGATTLEEYRKYIEKDSALERRFQSVMVEEPSVEETFDILQGLKSHYADHHYVIYPDATIGAAIRLTQRYLNERYLPDKAIDVLDEAGSRQNLNNELLVHERELELQLDELKDKEQELDAIDIADLASDDIDEFYKSQAILKQERLGLEEELQTVRQQLQRHEVSIEDVAEVIELWTGIPVQQITEAENEKLLKLEARLRERVIGQEEAIQALARAVRLRRAGFGKLKKPASFLFVGPTGVGKTESAKALAESLFDTEENLIRLDMSEYMEAHTVAKLIGSPPGYVGYDDAGQLSEKVRRHPYSVILLDEIEKAHVDVYNILLQILDDGRLSDSHGRTVNFENTVIIMTSNAGTSLKRASIGFNKDLRPDLVERVQTALRERFRPEFLNRIDETIVFNELGHEELLTIVDLMLKELVTALKLKGLTLEVTPEAKEKLVQLGYDPQFGARPLRRVIRQAFEDVLAELYLEGELNDKTHVRFDLKEDRKDDKSLVPREYFTYTLEA